MDKELPAAIVTQKKKRLIRIIVLVILLLVGVTVLMRYLLAPTLNRSAIITAIAEKGDVENTINASGEVLPEFEEVITSPINAAIQEVVMDAGSKVTAGQSILKLDKSTTQTAYEKGKFQLESKHNDIKKLKLELDKSYFDLQSNNEVKQLRINSLQADVENAKRLFKAGGGTRENIEKAELELKVAQLEKKQLENQIKSKQQSMQVEMRESEITAAIQESDLRALERQLQQASVVSSREGVVTWVNKNIGATIREGDALARIANLSSFKVTGSISDSYLDQLFNGMPAIIRINETRIRGMVTNVYPAVQNGVATFDIKLDEQAHKLLRANMKVEIYLITAASKGVIRVANGSGFKGTTAQDIFVVVNGKAYRRAVQIGMSNFDYVEIKDQVKPGDVVIISDMSAFKHAKEITIQP
jgi:HlyD family secretion protein